MQRYDNGPRDMKISPRNMTMVPETSIPKSGFTQCWVTLDGPCFFVLFFVVFLVVVFFFFFFFWGGCKDDS